MTKEQIEAILGRVLTWPTEKQALALRLLQSIEAESDEEYELTPEEESDLKEAVAEADRGEFLTDEEVTAFFARFR
jgi:predicted transcriptional regulator